jgi:hypothetical protein
MSRWAGTVCSIHSRGIWTNGITAILVRPRCFSKQKRQAASLNMVGYGHTSWSTFERSAGGSRLISSAVISMTRAIIACGGHCQQAANKVGAERRYLLFWRERGDNVRL